VKYRSKAGKIKYEHGMISGLREFLESLLSFDEIQSMIPGEIKPVKTSSPLTIRRLMPTPTGYKALVQSGGAVQEVFFIGKRESLQEILSKYLLKQED
jgi:hypothetical protein